MKTIKPSQSIRISLTLIGLLFFSLGSYMLSILFLHSQINLIAILILGFLVFIGFMGIYIGILYEIKIEKDGISTGSNLHRKKIFDDQIIGYFVVPIIEKNKTSEHLVLVLKNEKKKIFDTDTLGVEFKTLKKEIAKKYKKLPIIEKTKYHSNRKLKGLKIGSYIYATVFLFGSFLLFQTMNRDLNYVAVNGTLKEKPVYTYNRHNKESRISFQLNEYPNHTFSQVKNTKRFLKWSDQLKINDSIKIEISKDANQNKLLNSNPDLTFINYDYKTIEIKRLKNNHNEYIYKENQFEDVSLAFVVMGFGLIGLLYIFWKSNRIKKF